MSRNEGISVVHDREDVNTIQLVRDDALTALRRLPDESIDSIVTDPPYGLSKEPDIAEVLRHWLAGDDYQHRGGGFMGKSWDSFVPGPSVWRECLRVLKPGGHLLCFAGTRTVDLMGISIRLGGFEIRDEIVWLHGSGFPKSLNVSKAIDKAAGAEREVVGSRPTYPDGTRGGKPKPPHDRVATGLGTGGFVNPGGLTPITAPATEEARQWDGFGTALKPAHEPIIVARKPIKSTVANNVLEHGTGALNIDASRVGMSIEDFNRTSRDGEYGSTTPGDVGFTKTEMRTPINSKGRFPANVMLSHSPECEQVGTKKIKGVTGGFKEGSTGTMGTHEGRYGAAAGEATRDRTAAGTVDADGKETVEAWNCTEGCAVAMLDEQSLAGGMHSAGAAREGSDAVVSDSYDASAYELGPHRKMHRLGDKGGASRFFYTTKANKSERNAGLPDGMKCDHPTVKPIKLMEYLVRLMTPPGGTVLDPYVGSGTTMIGAVNGGFDGIGVDRDDEGTYLPVAEARITHVGGMVQR